MKPLSSKQCWDTESFTALGKNSTALDHCQPLYNIHVEEQVNPVTDYDPQANRPIYNYSGCFQQHMLYKDLACWSFPACNVKESRRDRLQFVAFKLKGKQSLEKQATRTCILILAARELIFLADTELFWTQ